MTSVVRLGDWELLLRLGLAVLLCSVIGLERSSRDEAAGLRTHALVGLGAALFTLVSAYGFADFTTVVSPRPDPTRIAAQIVSGVGFLGAGAIIRQGVNVRGVTTASSLWIVAAIGMAAGAGFYFGAVLTTGLVLVVLILLRRLRRSLMRLVGAAFMLVDFELRKGGQIGAALTVLARHRVSIEGMRSELGPEAERVHLDLRVPARLDFTTVLAELAALNDVAAVSCSGMRPEL
jgi:putative Mg2+ transporter-C (MgtC) family protein